MLARLNVRQKLGLLLILPLLMVLFASVPFVVERMDEARDAAASHALTRKARQVGALIQELQRERLLALGFLASPAVRRGALVAQAQAVTDRAEDVRTTAAAAADSRLGMAAGLNTLAVLRYSVLLRTVKPGAVHQAYQDIVRQLVAALRLGEGSGADLGGMRLRSGLDALLNTNEQAALAGAALVLAGSDRGLGNAVLREATVVTRLHAERFRQYATPKQSALLTPVERGQVGQRLARLAARLTGSGPTTPTAEALTAAEADLVLRRAVQNRIIGDLAARAADRASGTRFAAFGVVGLPTLLIGLVIWLGAAVGRSIAHPLHRLTRAARQVATLASSEMVRVADNEDEDSRPPRLAAVDVRTSDEIGELASAFNRVQATAALLMEQQMATRHNTAVMFANIARRTRSLASRQLAFIDELERDEPDPETLHKLYRLDHLTTRLRRSADSLLVISGTRDEDRMAAPATLADVVRSATAEIEGYRSVRLQGVPEVAVAPSVVPDLTLLLAELLENATAFSPPGTDVEVSATTATDCRISIVDHGIGMTAERLAEENQRLVERERLDVAPTGVLGLFVVGRLARRHGLRVRLSATPVQGVTAEVVVPPALVSTLGRSPSGALHGLPAAPVADPAAPGRRLALPSAPRPAGPPQQPAADDERFSWFPPKNGHGTLSVVGSVDSIEIPRPAPAPDGPAGLPRRQPGGHIGKFELGPAPGAPTAGPGLGGPGLGGPGLGGPGLGSPGLGGPTPRRNPTSERADLVAFQSGVARAGRPRPVDPGQAGPPTQPGDAGDAAAGGLTRTGLVRRVPGAHLAESARVAAPEPAAAQSARDAEAERAALDSFVAGLNRADGQLANSPKPDPTTNQPGVS